MQIITEVQQGSQEWLALRLGIITCSELECLLVNGKGEAGFGAGAFTYMNTLIGERITGAREVPSLRVEAQARPSRAGSMRGRPASP